MKCRRSEQQGSIFKSHGAYYGRWYTGRFIIGKDGQPKREQASRRLIDAIGDRFVDKKNARGELAKILLPINSASKECKIDSNFSLSVNQFAEEVFWPNANSRIKPSTLDGYGKLWRKHLKPRFEGFSIRDFSTVDATRMLTQIAREGLGERSVQHIRALGSMIFAEAAATIKGIPANPFRDAKLLVKPKEHSETYAAKPEEVLGMLRAFQDNPQIRVLIGLCYFSALRPGEAVGVHWEDIGDGMITIRRNIWRKQVVSPKTGSRLALCIRPLQQLLSELHNLKTGPILRGEKGGYLNLDYVNRKIIRPTLKASGIRWENFYSLRRGGITEALNQSNSLLGAAGVAGHANTQTTDQFYVKRVDETTLRVGAQFEASWSLLCSKYAALADANITQVQ